MTHGNQRRTYLNGKDSNGKKDILVAAPFSSDDSNPISLVRKGMYSHQASAEKLAKTASSRVPLNAGISGIAFDMSDLVN